MSFKASSILLAVTILLSSLLGILLPARQVPAAAAVLEVSQADETLPAKSLEIEAQLVPGAWVNLAFATGGQLTTLRVQEGDQVQAGEKLAQIGETRKYAADSAAAEFEQLSAQQALDDLQRNAAYQLALADKNLADAQKIQDSAAWKVKKLKEATPQIDIDQAYANLLLAQNQVHKLEKDLAKAQRVMNRKRTALIWRFVSRHTLRLMVTDLERQLALAQRRVDDATEKYHDLIEPPDEIELAQAEADLARANARVSAALRDRQAVLHGTDPDQLALANARLQVAESALAAARAAEAASWLVAPISGEVASVNVKTGEWAQPAQTLLVLADRSHWELETTDLKETEVRFLAPGAPVRVTVDALPGLVLDGTIRSISPLYVKVHDDIAYTARIDLRQSDDRLRWGMTGRIQVESP